MQKAKDTPLAEITLRRYERPMNPEKRDLVKKLCLSLGLLQPGDSRDVIVDVLMTLLIARKEQQELHSEEIKNKVIEQRKEYKLPILGVASSNIRRQLKRLRDLHLVEKVANNYRITEFSNLKEVFQENVEHYLLNSIINRVKVYLQSVDNEF